MWPTLTSSVWSGGSTSANDILLNTYQFSVIWGSTSANDILLNTYQFSVIWGQHIGERHPVEHLPVSVIWGQHIGKRHPVEHLPVLCDLGAAHRRTTSCWTLTSFSVIWGQHIGERHPVEYLPVLCDLGAAHRRTTTGWTRTDCTSGGRCRHACSLSGPIGSWRCSGLPVRSWRSDLGTWCHIYWETSSL